MKIVTSAANARYKALLKLAQSSRERKSLGLSLLDGIHLAAAYRAHVGMPRDVIVSRAGLENPEIQALLNSMAPLEPLVLSDGLFRHLSTVETPTGVLVAVRTPQPRAIPSDLDTCVMLEDVQDPGNLGSILRSIAAAGVRQVFLSRGTVHGWSPRVLRAAMGAHFMLEIHEQCDLVALAGGFRGRVIATRRRAEKSIFECDLTGRIALLIGNEGAGLSDGLLRMAHETAGIPMPGAVESLNVAAAAAICLFERVRQRAAGR